MTKSDGKYALTGTRQRCAPHLADEAIYSSHLRSNTMPQSPFGVPLRKGIGRRWASPAPGTPSTRGDRERGGRRAGHPDGCDRRLPCCRSMDGGEFPADRLIYYGGCKAGRSSDARLSLQKLGIEKVRRSSRPRCSRCQDPSRRSAMHRAKPSAQDIEAMQKAQGLGKRGLQSGDVLYIYTS